MRLKALADHEGRLNAADYGVQADGSTNDTSALQAALTAAGSANLDVLLPGGTIMASGLTVPDGVTVFGSGWQTIVKKNVNGAVFSLGTGANLRDFSIDGDGGAYTGVGVTIPATSEYAGEQQIAGMLMEDMQSYCVEYAAQFAGYASYIIDSILKTRADSTYAVKWADDGGSSYHGYRVIDNVQTYGRLCDASGSSVGIISNCITGGSVDDIIKMDADTNKVMVSDCRIPRGLTIDGTANQITNCISADDWTVSATADGCKITGCTADTLTVNGTRTSVTGSTFYTSATIAGDSNTLTGSVVQGSGTTLSAGAASNRVSSTGGSITDSSGSTGDDSNWIEQPPTAWTPTWTGGSPSIGNGTLAGYYSRQGRTVTANFKLVVGSSTSVGSGAWTFSLPLTAHYSAIAVGVARVYRNSTTTSYSATVEQTGGGTGITIYADAAAAAVGSATPFAWSTGDELHVTITYTM